jgi:hypothetical protein
LCKKLCHLFNLVRPDFLTDRFLVERLTTRFLVERLTTRFLVERLTTRFLDTERLPTRVLETERDRVVRFLDLELVLFLRAPPVKHGIFKFIIIY